MGPAETPGKAAMPASDRAEIEALIETYFESMYASDPDKVFAAFHPEARITGYMRGKLAEWSVPEFAEFVAAQQPSAASQELPRELEIVSLHVDGQTGVARVRDGYLGMTFLDTLSLLHSDGRWRIYDKLYHVEG